MKPKHLRSSNDTDLRSETKAPWCANGQFPQCASRLGTPEARHIQTDTRVSVWEKHGTQGQPSTKETTHLNLPLVERASTTEPRLHYARGPTPTVCRRPSSAARRRCSIPAHTQQRPRQQRANLQCAQCGADPQAYTGHTDNVLTAHMRQKHGGRTITPESVAQLRQLDRAACVICDTIRSRQCNRCNHCRADTAPRNQDTFFQDQRQPGHQDVAASQPILPLAGGRLSTRSTRRSPGDSAIQNCPIRDITDSDAHLLGEYHSVCRELWWSPQWTPVLVHPLSVALPMNAGGSSQRTR